MDKYLHDKKIPKILLSYMGTDESINLFLEGLNSMDTYENTDSGNKQSVFYDILSSYEGLVLENNIFKEYPKLNYFYYQRFLYTEEGVLGKDYQAWLRELEKYFEDRHGVKLNIQAPYLIQGYEYYPEH